jgi:DNA-binding PadR family transcriptional regulator
VYGQGLVTLAPPPLHYYVPRYIVRRYMDPALLILASLAAGPRHGYAMIEDIERVTGNRLGPGTLYGALARLDERGLIEALDGDDRRRPYRLTAAGAELLDREVDALERVVRMARDRLANE